MLRSDQQYSFYEMLTCEGDQPAPQIPDHLKCGEVYTWLCAGELYAVECKLCEDHPLCPLSEFPQHMDIWHTEWEEAANESHDKQLKNFISDESGAENNLGHSSSDRALSFTTEYDSGLFEADDQLHNLERAKTQAEHQEILEPFEQVLIEQDLTIDTTTTGISDEMNEEEYLEDVNEQAATIQNKQQQKATFVKQYVTVVRKEPGEQSSTTVKESELQHLTAAVKYKGKSVFYPAENVLNTEIQSKNQTHGNNINEIESAISGNKTKYIGFRKRKKCLKKFTLKTKSIQKKYSKLNEIKRALNKIIKDISIYKETDDTDESETSVASESKNYKRLEIHPINFTGLETSVTKNETNFLTEKLHPQTTIETGNRKNHSNKTVLYRNKKQVKKFNRCEQTKRILRNKNKSELKQNNFSFKISEQMEEHQTLDSKEPSKCNETKNDLRKNGKTASETNLKKKKRSLMANEREQNENEIENNDDKVRLNKKGLKIRASLVQPKRIDKEQSGNRQKPNKIETEQYENETKKRESQTKQNDDTTGSIENQFNFFQPAKTKEIEQNVNKIETIENETNLVTKKHYKNAFLKTTNKFPSNELKIGHKNLRNNVIGTSENEAIQSNHKKQLQSSLDYTIETAEKFLTRKRLSSLKYSKADTTGNESLFEENSTKVYINKNVKDKNEKLVGETEGTIRHETNNSNFLEYLQTTRQMRRKAKTSSNRKLRSTAKEEQTEINGNKTWDGAGEKRKCKLFKSKDITGMLKTEIADKIIDQKIRKSPRINESLKKCLKLNAREEINANAKGTNGCETLGSARQLRISENETILQEKPFKRYLSNETLKTNDTVFKCEHDKGMDATATLHDRQEINQYACSPENLRIENNINETKQFGGKNETNCPPNSAIIRKEMECFLKRKQITDDSEMILDENMGPTIERDAAAADHDYKRNRYKEKTLFNNIRKSLRNIRKNPKYMENSLQINEHLLKIGETNQIEALRFEKDDNDRSKLTGNLQRKNESYEIQLQKCPHNDLRNSKKDEDLETEALTTSNSLRPAKNQITKSEVNLHQSTTKSVLTARRHLRQLERNKLKRGFENERNNSSTKQKLHSHAKKYLRKNRRRNEKKAGQQILENLRAVHSNYRRKRLLQADKQNPIISDSSAQSMQTLWEIPEYLEANEMSALGFLEQKEQTPFASDISVCEEICFMAKRNDERIFLEQGNVKEICPVKERSLKAITITTDHEENNILAQESGEVNGSNQENKVLAEGSVEGIITIDYGESSILTKESAEVNVSEQELNVPAKETDAEGSFKSICFLEYGENNDLAQANVCDQEIPTNETGEQASDKDTIAIDYVENSTLSQESEETKEIYNEKFLTIECEDNSVLAQESAEANVTNQRAKDNHDQATQYNSEIQTENLQYNEETTQQLFNMKCIPNIPNAKPITDQASGSSDSSSTHACMPAATIAEPVSPLSPKTEEEHFEIYVPKEKLTKEHITQLIKLYHKHPRLWDQSHPDYCEPQMCRKSWQQITQEWNKHCHRKFTMAEVRIRICTLCQRFVQEKDRLALEGELDECAKFPYYEQMKFLEHQKSLRKRRELYEQQNEKILEIYQYFPILWHVRHYKSRQAKRRAEAFESISKVLKLFGLHLSSLGVQKRIRSLRKCYRLEKIRHLHAQVEQTAFEAEFRHYERMQFLDKHIDPFVCRICGKIFENLQGFREHLEAENHGSILQQDVDAENLLDQDEEEEFATKSGEFEAAGSPRRESFTESENSLDILQRFTPFPATPQPFREFNYSQNLECFSLNTANETLNNSWPFEDHIIEEIMENVTNPESFSQHGLEQFINSVTSCEEVANANTSLFEEVLSPSFLQTDNSSFIVEHPDVISGQTCSLLSPLTNVKSLISNDFGTGNSLMMAQQHSDLRIDHNLSGSLPVEATVAVATNEIVANECNLLPTEEITGPIKELEKQVTAEVIPQQPSSCSSALLIKVQCADYSVNLKLNTEPLSMQNARRQDTDNDLYSSGDNSTAPLSDLLIHKMIELYRKFPQLWDPNHLDFNSRTLRRQAWVNLTIEFNSIVCKQLSWRTLHRKLTDYAKYYKKLVTEQGNYESLENKWAFYEDFKFLDDVIAVNTELQRTVHHRDNNFKIITTYQAFPQLWNIKHADFSKRSCKQRNIEAMCNRLQEEHNLQLTTERLKNRLIELRAQYRMAKKQRLKCLKNQQQFSASEFEFYEALNFLDEHIDPFNCDKCKMEFKKLTDYNQHLKKEHAPKKQRIILPPAQPGMENVCHICGLKFTTRSNLAHHVKRHEGIRNYACTMCPKTFYASHALKVHIRSHTKECPYTCEKCGMSFVSASKLNQHVKRHLNQKDFECSYCPKTFFTAFEKDRHERRHLNIRDKACLICGKTFVAGSSYYAHLMLHSETKRFECDQCDMKFAQYPGLFKHKKRHHT